MANSVIPRPFLKWAGGKTQLLDDLTAHLPRYFHAYHEPFIGGGALFFHLYRQGKIRQAFIADLNAELIDTYIAIRDHVEDVIQRLSEYPYDEKFYYELRAQDPWQMDRPERAARMIYLNKTGYNGLYPSQQTRQIQRALRPVRIPPILRPGESAGRLDSFARHGDHLRSV